MSDRSYGQFCALARALDVIGDRWTLLLVRELLAGPRRHSELKRGLPGIATNLLSQRLRELKEEGVIERIETDGTRHYRLTERGRALRQVLIEMARWGTPLLPALGDDADFHASWLALTLEAHLDKAAARVEPTSLRITLDGEPLDLAVDADGVRAAPGDPPELEVQADRITFLSWGLGVLSDAGAVAGGMRVTRGRAGLRRLRRLFPVRAAP